MERLSTTGIVGSGVLSDDNSPQDWERRIAERAEQLYRLKLLRKLLVVWLCPGNLLLAVVAAVGPALWGSGLLAAVLGAALVASVAVSGRLLYREHLAVRGAESELRALECANREELLDELGSGDLLGAQRYYRAQLPDIIERHRAEARRDRWKDNVLQSAVIGGSIVAATVTAVAMSIVEFGWIAVAVSLVVAVSAAFSGYAKYRERALGWQQAADALEREYQSVELRAGRYRRFENDDEAYAEFADTVEALRNEQVQRLRSTVSGAIGQ